MTQSSMEKNMVSNSEKASDVSSNQLLKGLNDKELFEICVLGQTNYYNAGDALFKEGDIDQALFLILKGAVKITRKLHGHEIEITILYKDEGLGGITFIKGTKRTASATVLEPSTIIIIDDQSMDMLSPDIQLHIYKNLNNVASKSIDNLIFQGARLVDQNIYLGTRIRAAYSSKVDEYTQSEEIQYLLQSIPKLPMYTTNLVILLQEENVSINEVVSQAKLDPSLVGAILKTINSAYYSLRNKISDVQHAITYLGFNQVYQLVIDNGVRSTMPDTPKFQELQLHSNIISIFAFNIAKLSNLNKPIMLSTIGLLHDIGKSVIFLLKQQHQRLSLLIDQLDFASIGSLLLRKWNIPNIVCRTLEEQSLPEIFPPSKVTEECRENTSVLYLAHICCEYIKGSKEEDLPTAFIDEHTALLDFSEASFFKLLKSRIIPSVYKDINSYPENVRRFLLNCKSNLVEEISTSKSDTNINNLF